jgi:hypothetical protein
LRVPALTRPTKENKTKEGGDALAIIDVTRITLRCASLDLAREERHRSLCEEQNSAGAGGVGAGTGRRRTVHVYAHVE